MAAFLSHSPSLMNLALRPATLHALNRFRRRRSRLLWIRGLLCLIGLTAGLLVVVALLDRAWFLPDAVRPWVSVAAYAGGIIAAWRVAIRFLNAAKNEAAAAVLIEAAEPSLRERLLAAVELAKPDASDEIKDSAEFREKLQDDVAAAVAALKLKKALPAKSLRPWWLLLIGAFALAAMLSLVPVLHLPGFLVRAALPFANLERPSSVKIQIIRPSPSSTKAPIASEIELAIDVIGPQPGRVIVESAELGAKARRIELTHAAGNRFEAKLAMGQADLRYRVRAADAITPWHTLTARPRPRVVEFSKTIVPPAYAGLKSQQLTEDHGDVETLEGSTVKLTLKTNQPIAKAAMILNPDQPTHPSAPATAFKSPAEITTELTVNDQNESWQIALTSEETGFSNDEASPWRITAIPDLPPTAQITEPTEQIALLPDEGARLAGLATDDIGLASILISHAVNGTQWKERELASKPGKEAAVQHLFSLAPLGVKAGDTVLLKLIAVDLKGQKAESQPLRIMVLEQTVDPKYRQWAAEQRRLASQAQDLAEKTRDLAKAMQQVQKNARLERKNKEPNAPENALAKAQEALDQVKDQADDLWNQLKQAARSAPTPLDAQEVQLLGKRLAQLRQESIPEMQRRSQEPVENPDQLRKTAAEAGNHAETLVHAARAFAAEDTARVTAQAAQQLHRQESLLTENALPANRDASMRPQWQEQQRAAIAASESVRKDVAALESQVDSGQKRNLEQLKNQVAEAANDLNESLDKPNQNKSPEHLYGASDNLRQRLGRIADAAHGTLEFAANQAANLRQKLQAADNPAMLALEEGRAALQQAEDTAKHLKQRQKPPQDGLTPEKRAAQNLTEAARQLQDQAELREQNPLTNDQAALDMNRTSRAADKLARQAGELAKTPSQSVTQPSERPAALQDARTKTARLAEAARTLEADALAQSAMNSLVEAAQPPQPGEKTNAPEAATRAQSAAEQLRELPQALRRAQAPNELAAAAQQAADSAKGASDSLQNQAKQMAAQPAGQPPQPLNQQPAADALQKTAAVAEQLAPRADAARQALAQLTPQLSEMMKAMAQDLNQTRQETQKAANDAKASQPVDQVAQQAQQLRPEAAKNAEGMNSLQAALRQEANQADLAQADKRQLARTADVALEQMRQKSPAIAQNLKQAAQANQSQMQAESLQNAASLQQQTAEALNQLAQNFQKMEQGQELSPQELAAMQQMEQQLDVQEPLDEAYNRAKQLAELAKDANANPAEVLQELEKELPKNPPMQKALAEIGKATAQTAEQSVTEKADQPANLSMAAEFAAHDLGRVARHQQRLGQKEAAQQTAKASNDLQQTAMATKSDPSKASQQVAQQAMANATQAAKSAEQTAAVVPPAMMSSPFEQAQGIMLAQALDQLDKTLHPMQSSGPLRESQQNQQAAQQSLNDAKQSQQQAMANARNQGQVPGQKSPSQQTAQNKQQQNEGQQSQEGGNFSQQLKDGVLGEEMVLVNGDWGHLPSRMAKDLTEATRQEAPAEYRAAIESYYKAIATKSKQ